jgi:hypothetical protein
VVYPEGFRPADRVVLAASAEVAFTAAASVEAASMAALADDGNNSVFLGRVARHEKVEHVTRFNKK